MSEDATHTWDGLPMAKEPPFGASVVVFRRGRSGIEILMLHRSHNGPDYEGDWAWTPPSGGRQPGEAVETCARRELAEEAGLHLDVRATDIDLTTWAVYVAEVHPDTTVELTDPEHDRYRWLTPAAALACCAPEHVRLSLQRAIGQILALQP